MSVLRTIKRSRGGELERGVIPGGMLAQILASGGYGSLSTEQALRHAAVWACVRRIAGTVSTMPCDAVLPSGSLRIPVVPRPQLLSAPSAEVSATNWRFQVLASLLLRGNGYGDVVAVDAMQFPTQIELRHPDTVAWRPVEGRLTPHIDNKPVGIYPNGDLWHVAAFLLPGSPVGLNPIEYARTAVLTGLNAEWFGDEFFMSGGHPTALFKSEQKIDDTLAKAVKNRILQVTKGSREPLVLGSGLGYEQLQVNPSDSQFLETQRFSAEQVCRIFGVQPEMIGLATSGSSVTYANREQRNTDFLQFCLLDWMVRVEEALTALLPGVQEAKFNPAGLLRGDLGSRYTAYQTAIRNGWRSRNEVRALENEAPLPGGDGDEFLWPPYRAFPIPEDTGDDGGESNQ